MVNIATDAFCYIYQDDGSFLDIVWYDLIITDRIGRLLSYVILIFEEEWR